MKSSPSDGEDDAGEQLQRLYRSGVAVRSRGMTSTEAHRHYASYVEFVTRYAKGESLLDVGCGNGWSTSVFATGGYRAIGIDLNPIAFEPPPQERLTLVQGSALEIPYEDNSFDIVSSYQVLEHVPDPQRMLDEMLRVAKPGGTICIVGPNLIGLAGSAMAITKHVWTNRPLATIFFRTPSMPRHPFGNTLSEAIIKLFANVAMISVKALRTSAHFTMRPPDLNPPFHADNDATYLCNPIDLVRFFRSHDCEILVDSRPGRRRLTQMLATGTWVAVRKAGKIG